MNRAATWIKDTFSSLNPPSVQDLFLETRTDYLFLNAVSGDAQQDEGKQAEGTESSESSQTHKPGPLLIEMTRKVQIM